MRDLRAIFAAAATGWWVGAAALAQNPPVIRTESRTVLVDAIVTGKNGEFMRDLTSKDFRLWQDGKEQRITSLSLMSDSSPQPQPSGPHFLVLFFDDTRLAAQDQAVARQAASRFIDANVSPRQLIAVVSYNGSLRIAQNFTDNAGRLKDALNRVESSSSVITDNSKQGPRRSAAPPSTENFGARNMLESLADLTRGLGVLPGRKSAVLMTGGLPSAFDLKSGVNAAIESASRSDVAIYPVNVQPLHVDVDPNAGPSRSSNPLFYRFPRGGDDPMEVSPDPTVGEQLLVALAKGTGGDMIRDSSQLLAGLQQIGEEQREYYVLSYAPPESKDGSCHALRVKVDRGGATVRARSDYCATKPQDLIAETDAAKDLENRAAGKDAGNLRASIQLPYFYISPGVARVHLAMELAPGALKLETQQKKLHAEINLLGIASASDGGVAARFSDTLKLDFDSEADFEKRKDAPVHYEKEFKIAPGQYNFALTFGSSGASFGKIETPLEVDAWSGAALALSGIALSRETHPAGDLGLVSSLVADRTPLIAEENEFVPTGSSTFAKSEAGYFYFEVNDADPASVRVRVRVVARASAVEKWDSGLVALPPSANAGKGPIPAGASLRINTLDPGSYRLEITASDASGKQLQRTADFEVR